MPLGGMVLLGNMMLDEVIIGGPGSGLFGMLLFAIVAVFIAGLMIGRTPEYVGNKIEAREVKLTMLALLAVPAALLLPTARGGGDSGRPARDGQRRPARFHRGAVCLFLGRQHQRQFLRRPVHQHAVLQSDAGAFDGGGPLPGDRAGAGTGGLACHQAARRGIAWHAADHRRAVGRSADWRDRDRWRPDLPAGTGARADRPSISRCSTVRCSEAGWPSPWRDSPPENGSPRRAQRGRQGKPADSEC
jgi:hypothetical protein